MIDIIFFVWLFSLTAYIGYKAYNPYRDLIDVYHYIVGNTRMWLYNNYKYLLTRHITEQYEDRLKKANKECINQGACIACGCKTPELFMADKACEENCYEPMKSKKDWNHKSPIKVIFKLTEGAIIKKGEPEHHYFDIDTYLEVKDVESKKHSIRFNSTNKDYSFERAISMFREHFLNIIKKHEGDEIRFDFIGDTDLSILKSFITKSLKDTKYEKLLK